MLGLTEFCYRFKQFLHGLMDKFKSKHRIALPFVFFMLIAAKDFSIDDNQNRLAHIARVICRKFKEDLPKSTTHGLLSDPKMVEIAKETFNFLIEQGKSLQVVPEFATAFSYLAKSGITSAILHDGTCVKTNSPTIAGVKTTPSGAKGKKQASSSDQQEGAARKTKREQIFVAQVGFDLALNVINSLQIISCNAHEHRFDEFDKSMLYIYDRGVGKGYCDRCHESGAFYLTRARKHCQNQIIEAYDIDGNPLPQLEGMTVKYVPLSYGTFEAVVADKGQNFDNAKALYLDNLKSGSRMPTFIRRFVRFVYQDDNGNQQALLTFTNLSRHQIPLSALTIMYRLRWVVELVFKVIKSQCGLKPIKSSIPNIVETLFYASLCNFQLKAIMANLVGQHHFSVKNFVIEKLAYCTGRVKLLSQVSLFKFCDTVKVTPLIKAIIAGDDAAIDQYVAEVQDIKLAKKVQREASEYVHKSKKAKAIQLIVANIAYELKRFFDKRGVLPPTPISNSSQIPEIAH